VFLEKNPEGDVSVFDLKGGKLIEDGGPGLVGELGGGLDALLLRLELLLETLDFRLNGEDSVLAGLDTSLEISVFPGSKNKPPGERQSGESGKVDGRVFWHGDASEQIRTKGSDRR
jgi:hypothetical protein